MSTELHQVVQSMSQVSIPQEILNKVDMKNLLKGFSDDYKKLNDLKVARARHEDRNFVSRWWNNDELENAQLDAAELQASFSKKLGQLMVISVAQSQQLNQQQMGLSDQQRIIKRQTEQLAENDEHLNNQQLSLEEQNKKLEKLVNDYFELKGLTQDGALKLIKIANEVKETKDSLMMSFGNRMQEIDGIRQNILIEQSELVNRQTQRLNTFTNEAERSQEAHHQQIEQRIKQALQQINQTDEQLQLALKTTEQHIVETLSQALEQQKQQQAGYNLLWQEDKTQVLDSLAQHHQGWMQEVQEQNSRLEVLQADNNKLQKQLSKQAQQHLQQVEALHKLFDYLKVESTQLDLNWQQRWKIMTCTMALALTVLTTALGYLAYTSYYQLPLF
ncbi:hypothetical protein MWT71_001876 [Vibrio parahaemolyticus]|nr:hypothetical protein [Vibrio parahaemolyticus]EGQ9184454.1 hypothetical protein [Vibrio parahaemolyticus]EHH1250895.1 hypothetical protein [Vibrio parahaemolyticus]EHW0629526.1 hypothetical protein [Vibrio parahaemolyticus]EJA3302795.1 hypothetical protein [Vibrio parahaemolyticus]